MGKSHVRNSYAQTPREAKIVKLADFPKRTSQSIPADTTRGEILLFTGIRYERQTEPTEPDPRDTHQEDGPGRRRRKRRV